MKRVEIRITGHIDEDWADWFGDLEITHSEGNETVLTATVSDQSALYGLLARLRDLGLALISVESKETDAPQ